MLRSSLWLALICLAVPAQAQTIVYVSIGGGNTINVYEIDEQHGQLNLRQQLDVPEGPGPIAFHPTLDKAYVALGQGNQVGLLDIAASGQLSRVGAIAMPGEKIATYLHVDRSGKFLLSAYYTEGLITVVKLGPQGELIDARHQVIQSDIRAHSIQTDESNRFAYCPHTAPINRIDQFRFDAEQGLLTANDPPYFPQPAADIGPRHFCFHPGEPLLYAINENGSSMSSYQVDQQRGTLSLINTVSTLPAGFTEKNTCAHVELHPNGKVLYGSNRGHDSIAVLKVNPQTGELSAGDHTPCPAVPRSFHLVAKGKFLVVAGQKANQLAVYRVDADTGALTETQRLDVGKNPNWVDSRE